MIKLTHHTTSFDSVLDWILRLIAVVISIFSDAKTVLHAVLFLILIDQVFGVVHALRERKFSWKIFNQVYTKVIIYISVILAAFVYERYLLNSQEIYFTKIMAALVGFQELSSSYMTFAKITGIKIFEIIFTKIKG